MNKILILCYDFPPNSNVASFRPYSWYRYFKENNLYPIVLTSDKNLIGLTQEQIFHLQSELNEFGCTIYVPQKKQLVDILLGRKQTKITILLRKVVSFFTELNQFNVKFNNYKNFITESKKIIDQHDGEIKVILVTGGPFPLFKVADILSKDNKIPWIGDLRDTWSLSKARNKHIFTKILNSYYEKKLIKNAIAITTVSEHLQGIFKKKWNREVFVFRNGFNDWNFNSKYDLKPKKDNILKIALSGSIYSHHPIKEFLMAIRDVHNEKKAKLEIHFFGVNIEDELKKIVVDEILNLDEVVFFHKRLENKTLIKELKSFDLLLLFNEYNISGTKIYEYLAIKKMILFCFMDKSMINFSKYIFKAEKKDLLDENNWSQLNILKKTQGGIFINNPEHLKIEITRLYNEYVKDDSSIPCNSINIEEYSRRSQAKFMADLIHKYIKKNELN
jgi:hypothetical protein